MCYHIPVKAAIDEVDARILELIQRDIPLVHEPFREIGTRLSLDPADVISRLARCKREGLLRRLGAIVDSAALGYRGALIAFRVRADRLDAVGEAVALRDLISHCYSRDDRYNLWFTLTTPPAGDLEGEVAALASQEGVESFLILPALRVFRLAVFLRLTDSPTAPVPVIADRLAKPAVLTDADKAALRVLQEDLPLTEGPYGELAARAGLTEDELLDRARDLLARGIIRRFAGVLNHRAAGYTHNAMVCWAIGTEEVESVGPKLAEDWAVSHCYERPAFPDWPYTLYTMIHCRTQPELGETVDRLAAVGGNAPHAVLRTLKEYKKSRGRYAA
jgi:siroheme decarboxylase